MKFLFNYCAQRLKKYWAIFFITFIFFIVAKANYTAGTYLTGWDNLHSEFNFSLNIKRSVFSVWQEYQGLGLLAGMAHAADLPRQILLLITSVFLPNNLIRYFYHFLMVFTGMIGTYIVLKNIFLDKFNKDIKVKSALLGSIFYLFNLGTIQYFYVPFESYSTFWGMFPWEVYSLLLYLQHPTLKRLLFLTIINLIAIPQSYVQTIFLVYIIVVFVIIFLNLVSKFRLNTLKQSVIVLAVIFCLNAFWLLPNIFFTISNINITQNAMQNIMVTDKFSQMNQFRGTIKDFAVLKEYYFDVSDYDYLSNKVYFLMENWRNHFDKYWVLLLGYVLFFIVLMGLFSKNIYRAYLLSIFAICMIIFLSDVPIISSINSLFRSLSVVNQIFRNPLTKFIVPLVFLFAVGFGLGTSQILSNRVLKGYKNLLIFILLLILPITYVYPVLKGHFISPQMRVNIPKEYFDLFAYFSKEDKNGRIMNLPQGSFWGWNFYRWGVHGSGFLWYGIEQPILDRAFDVWSDQSEEYYWQLNYALQKKDTGLFDNILEKYNVEYIIFDSNIVFDTGQNSEKTILSQEDFLSKNTKIRKVSKFGNIIVYKTNLNNFYAKNFATTRNLYTVGLPKSFNSQDKIYPKLGNYKNLLNSVSINNPDFVFPFSGISSGRFQNYSGFKITEDNEATIFESSLPKGDYNLSVPTLYNSEKLIPVKIYAKSLNAAIVVRLEQLNPKIYINENLVSTKPDTQDIILIPNTKIQFPVYASVNNKDFFRIDKLENNFSFLGETYLYSIDNYNYFKLFSGNNSKNTKPLLNKFSETKNCGGLPSTELFSDVIKDQLILQAKNSAVCSVYNSTIEIDGNSLVNVEFTYKSKADEFPSYCFYSENSSNCLNKKDNIIYGFSLNPRDFSEYFEDAKTQKDNVYLHMILDGLSDQDRDKLKEIAYKDILITTYPYIAGSVINLNSDDEDKVNLNLDKDSLIKVRVPKIESSFTYKDPIKEGTYKKTALSYNKNTNGEYNITEIADQETFLSLNATSASSDLALQNNDLYTASGYLLRIDSANPSGLPLLLNAFTSQDAKTYLYTYLDKNNGFSKNYFILPPLGEFDQGIKFLMATHSYNRLSNTDYIKSVSLYPVPYNYLTDMYLSKKAISKIHTNNTTVQEIRVKKYNYSFYQIYGDFQAGDTLIFSQGFHPGWSLYIVGNNFLGKIIPFVFGSKVNDHIVVNGWENGWVLSDLDAGIGKDFVAIFIPQYLEYLGFVLLIIPFLWVVPARWLS